MQPDIKRIGAFKIVGPGARFIGVRSPDATAADTIPQLWDELFRRMGEIGHAIHGPCYGVCECLPDGERKHDDEYFYIAGCQVDSLNDLPDRMSSREIPAATYLAFTHKGTLETLPTTMEYIYGSWLPGAPYERAAGPDLELYDERFDPASDTSEMDILIPIRYDEGAANE